MALLLPFGSQYGPSVLSPVLSNVLSPVITPGGGGGTPVLNQDSAPVKNDNDEQVFVEE